MFQMAEQNLIPELVATECILGAGDSHMIRLQRPMEDVDEMVDFYFSYQFAAGKNCKGL